MISYKAALLISLLGLGGVCSAIAVNHFIKENRETEMLEVYCQHYRYSKTPFPGCEAGHVAD